jgi:hypothetical protein
MPEPRKEAKFSFTANATGKLWKKLPRRQPFFWPGFRTFRPRILILKEIIQVSTNKDI